jgi:6-phosphogluconolactonase/glucosamine-6-phosphate isomerase/deaminase
VTLDVVHLGLGADGHTASLFPGDAGLGVRDRAVTVTAEHGGYRRLSLTLPALNRARRIVWLATGAAKAAVVGRLIEGNWSAPAGRIARDQAIVVTDKAAAGTASTADFKPPGLP